MKIIGIYGLRCRTTGKWYIGKSLDVSTRWRKYQQLHCKRQPKIYNAIKKYGFDNFDRIVVEECCREVLSNREVYWISKYNSFHDGYNLTEGGEGGATRIGRVASEESRRKMSESARLRAATGRNQAATAEGKQKLRKIMPCRSDYTTEERQIIHEIYVRAQAMKRYAPEDRLTLRKLWRVAYERKNRGAPHV